MNSRSLCLLALVAIASFLPSCNNFHINSHEPGDVLHEQAPLGRPGKKAAAGAEVYAASDRQAERAG